MPRLMGSTVRARNVYRNTSKKSSKIAMMRGMSARGPLHLNLRPGRRRPSLYWAWWCNGSIDRLGRQPGPGSIPGRPTGETPADPRTPTAGATSSRPTSFPPPAPAPPPLRPSFANKRRSKISRNLKEKTISNPRFTPNNTGPFFKNNKTAPTNVAPCLARRVPEEGADRRLAPIQRRAPGLVTNFQRRPRPRARHLVHEVAPRRARLRSCGREPPDGLLGEAIRQRDARRRVGR